MDYWQCGSGSVTNQRLRRAPDESSLPRFSRMFIVSPGDRSALDLLIPRLFRQGIADEVWVTVDAERAADAVSSRPAQTLILGSNTPWPPNKTARDVGPVAVIPDTPTRFLERIDLMGWYSAQELLMERGPDGRGRVPLRIEKMNTTAYEDVRLVGPATCPYEEAVGEHGITWVRVCPGLFTMGSVEGAPDEQPEHRVRMSGFWIQKYEMSNHQAKALGFSPQQKAAAEDWPLTDVSWTEAKKICRQAGGRLPTEAEWEYAARGWQSHPYPWGTDTPQPSETAFSVPDQEDPFVAVNAYEGSQGPFGAHHQAGNVWEWVEDCYAEETYRNRGPLTIDPRVDRCPSEARVRRGGSALEEPGTVRSTTRRATDASYRNRDTGLRCVWGARPAAP